MFSTGQEGVNILLEEDVLGTLDVTDNQVLEDREFHRLLCVMELLHINEAHLPTEDRIMKVNK